MATRMSTALPRDLRYEPIAKRIRACVDGATVADSADCVVVWEPDVVVPFYAFPQAAVRAALRPATEPAEAGRRAAPAWVWDVDLGDRALPAAAWTYRDPDLEDRVVLRWSAMDAWYEEDERALAHARDPFIRIDVRRSSRHVRVLVDDEVVAESRRPLLLFETGLPVRFYFDREDVRCDSLHPSETQTECAYKGRAAYFSVEANGRRHPDVAWTYPYPLPGCERLRGLVAFLDERVDVEVDGLRLERPRTKWS